jgi:NAD-dependent deacetylase
MKEARELAHMIAAANRVVFFTGAGISTESGIPDFRSPGGVWTKMAPIMFQEFVGSRDKRREAWDRVFKDPAGWLGAAPNEGHRAVASLIGAGKAACVITQNVDNLHLAAGAPADRVIEIHGNASFARCLDCKTRYELDALRPRWEAGGEIDCAQCGGLIKTAVVSFGQDMPAVEMARAMDEAEACDLFIVLGSSLVVWPAAALPNMAKKAGAKLVIVNREPTELDSGADLILNVEIGPLMSATMGVLAAQ